MKYGIDGGVSGGLGKSPDYLVSDEEFGAPTVMGAIEVIAKRAVYLSHLSFS